MKQLYFIIVLLSFSILSNIHAQTDPTAQSLPFSFTSLSGTSLPAGIAAHRFGTSAGSIPTTRTTSVCNGDIANASGNSGGWNGEAANGISILASGSQAAGAIVVAVNTTGKSTIQVSWKAGTILQQASRDHSVALQYRVGTTGSWTDVGTSSTYSSAGQTAGSVSGTLTETLPAAANNKSVVQIRWVYWESAGTTGSRDRINIDEISIVNLCTPPTTSVLSSAVSSLCNGSSTNLSVAITGGTSPYTVVYSDGSNQTVNSYTSGSNISVSPTSNTTYSLVSVTDANSCASLAVSGTPTITVNPRPSASVLSSTSSVFCSGGSSNLKVNITGGTSPFTVVYNDGTNQTVNSYTSASNISVSPTATTSYSLVSVTDANGCTSTGLSGTPTITLVSASTNATLAASSTTSNTVEQCTDGAGWTYYATSGAPTQLLFGIKKGSNTFNALVDITAGATISKTSSNGVNQENGMFLMGRYWDVTLNSGTITTPVDIRFFYDPNELTAAKTARDAAFAALPGTTLAVTNGNTAEWFKSINSAFNASYISSILGNKFPGTIQKYTSPSTGTLNGVDYVELTGITSFSGGTGGFSFGANGGSGNSLPVTWASFDVKSTEMGNKLTWETASEKNTSHFEVEYSYDGKNFTTVNSKINAAGNSSILSSYNYTHADFASIIYYRIKQIDNDNRFSYSEIKSVKRTSVSTPTVSVYPIPLKSDNILKLKISSIDLSEINLKMINLTGKVVYSNSILPKSDLINETIDLSNLPSGIYFLEIKNGQFKTVKKLFK